MMKWKTTKKAFVGTTANVFVGGQLLGTIKNIQATETNCSCGSKAEKFKPGHKADCAWWVFNDQHRIDEIAKTGADVPSYVLGANKPELYRVCDKCEDYESGHSSYSCPDHQQ